MRPVSELEIDENTNLLAEKYLWKDFWYEHSK